MSAPQPPGRPPDHLIRRDTYVIHFPTRLDDAVDYYERDPFAHKTVDMKARETGRPRMAILNEVAGGCIAYPKALVSGVE